MGILEMIWRVVSAPFRFMKVLFAAILYLFVGQEEEEDCDWECQKKGGGKLRQVEKEEVIRKLDEMAAVYPHLIEKREKAAEEYIAECGLDRFEAIGARSAFRAYGALWRRGD